MLREFWSKYRGPGVHPDDRALLDERCCLDWTPADAEAHARTFERETALHDKLHINLCPQPFVGNLETSSVYVLFGNPGFAISDYADEAKNSEYAAACARNLRQSGQGSFLLLPEAIGTGAANYWQGRLRSLIKALAERLAISIAAATDEVIQRVTLIEAGAYHSKGFPGAWCDDLPSSRAARAFVHRVLVPKAERGEALIFIWRRATFWDVPADAPGVIFRPPKQAQLKNLTVPERTRIVEFLASRVQSGN